MVKIEMEKETYVYFGAYPQDGTEKQPIKWRILKREGNILTLIADRILTNFMYDRYFSDYNDSALRKYIHDEFIPVAFTGEELQAILPTQLEGVVDKVFIPSVDEIRHLSREDRIRKVTPFAYANKASTYPIFSKKEKHLEGNGWYWTRTPYKPPYNPRNNRQIWYVEYNGALNFRVTVGHDIGIVPIIRIAIDE